MRNKLLEIEGLTVAFPQQGSKETSVPVLNHVSFSLEQGESLGIVGESGSGKSMTVLSLMGLLPNVARLTAERMLFRTADRVYDLCTLDNVAFRTLRGKSISMIFQDPMTALNASMRCGKQVLEALTEHTPLPKKAAKAEVLRLFAKLRIPSPEEAYQKYPHQMSGGQLQRVLIAIALINRPQLLIADEPTTALDVGVQQDILLLLNDLKKEYGLSMIFISHDLGIVSQVSDRVMVMQAGKVVETAGVHALFTRATHPYTKALIACRPTKSMKNKPLKTVRDFVSDSHE